MSSASETRDLLLAPADNREAAIVAPFLTPGNYTAVVRGAAPPPGEGSIRDVLMPKEFDLFA